MSRSEVRKLALNTFAFSIFCFGLVYITRANDYAAYYSPLPGRVLLVYLNAFVDFAIASSIFMNLQVSRVCYWGGIFLLLMSVITLGFQVANGKAESVSESIMLFISSIGYRSAIFFISTQFSDSGDD